MSCGIYLLKFIGTSKVYIGQSLDIEGRYLIHRSKLKSGTHTAKLLEAYRMFGLPTLEILIECDAEDLDLVENEAIEIYDSVINGFNSCKTAGGGNNSFGEDVGNSKFTNLQTEKVFVLLATNQELSCKEISKLTNVSEHTVKAISGLKVHKWLHIKYPELYKALIDRPTSRFGKGKTLKEKSIEYPPLLSPEGVYYIVENTSKFAKDHNLNNGHLVQVLKGKEKQHKGWKLDGRLTS